ncbi:hypothetical protein Shyd_83030 [Streptomyces hydrogenans]|uniref:Uncharacterized protein n=1 Tax=Streptomyces hydrogenans TaxID=1873719 RepID=A0ABQ3PPI2_9ACTN|nr:hypothetical protein Shyd_83030 [Streptomyces hydrogenans]
MTRKTHPHSWEVLLRIAELIYRHKVGVVVERGTPETSWGPLAVYAAEAGIPHPAVHPASAAARTASAAGGHTHATPRQSRINERPFRHEHRGKEFGFLVVEDYERMSPTNTPTWTGTTRSTTWTTNPPTPAEELLRGRPDAQDQRAFPVHHRSAHHPRHLPLPPGDLSRRNTPRPC